MSQVKFNRWAVYSEQQKARGGSVWYEAPNGERLEVTCVEDTRGCPRGCGWDDKIDVGWVGRFLGRASEATDPVSRELNRMFNEMFLRESYDEEME